MCSACGARLSCSATPRSVSSSRTGGFRVVEGTVANSAAHFTTAAGVTYELSTAPGVAADPSEPGQAIYSTSDGEHWTTAAQDQPWISGLTEHDGVLYAIFTAPGAAANDVRYVVGTSHDGGGAWSDTDLPFDTSAPTATVSLSRSSAVEIASGATETVALLTEQFSPDLDALVAARAAGHDNVTTQMTKDGYDILDLSNCTALKQGLAPGSDTTLLHSTHARTWTPIDTPPGLDVQQVAGDRIVGLDASGAVETSADGGTTWNTTDVNSLLPAGTPASAVSVSDAGPLGFAVLATGKDATGQTPGDDYLLFSTDGTDGTTTDLATVGQPSTGYPMQVTVGADHISIDFGLAGPTPSAPMKITTLLATPKS